MNELRDGKRDTCCSVTASLFQMTKRCDVMCQESLRGSDDVEWHISPQTLEQEEKDNEAVSKMMALDQKNQLLNLFHEKNRPTLAKWPPVGNLTWNTRRRTSLDTWCIGSALVCCSAVARCSCASVTTSRAAKLNGHDRGCTVLHMETLSHLSPAGHGRAVHRSPLLCG